MSKLGWIKRPVYGILALAIAGATAGLSAVLSSGSAGASGSSVYYLALGDSLSVGWQPTGSPAQGLARETTQGYDSDLYKFYEKRIPGLKLEQLGCPGETTGSMVDGGCSGQVATPYPSGYPGGSQLAAAESFIENNDVAFVTLDIGANDVDNCAAAFLSGNEATFDSCFGTGLNNIQTYLPQILEGLGQAESLSTAGSKGAVVYAMNYYDPFLAVYLEGGSKATAALGTVQPGFDSNYPGGLVQTFNGDLASDFAAAATQANPLTVTLANVQDAFRTFDTNPPSTYTPLSAEKISGLRHAASVPTNDPTDVQEVCALTWECGSYENIHANVLGYEQIAVAFEAVMGGLP